MKLFAKIFAGIFVVLALGLFVVTDSDFMTEYHKIYALIMWGSLLLSLYLLSIKH